MKIGKEEMLGVYNKFKYLLAEKNYDFKFEGFKHFANKHEYAVLYFGEKGTNWEETGWEITELKEGDVLTVMYNLYLHAVETLESENKALKK